jgi:hypothetical protein
MLEKYRKLAQDAHLNGDRVQAEYYLQFADHYFRVSADTRARQEEQRGARRDERHGEGGFDETDDNEFGNENDIPGFDQPMTYRREDSREPREPREERQPRDNREPRENREPRSQRPADDAREPRGYEQRGPQRPRGDTPPQGNEAAPGAGVSAEGEPAGFNPPANPFVRSTRGLRPRREREERPAVATGSVEAEGPSGFDASILPPAIAEARAAVIEGDAEDAPAPRRRGRPRKVPIVDDGGSLEVVTN